MWLTNCTVIDVEDPDRSFTGALRIEEGRIVETSETRRAGRAPTRSIWAVGS